MTANKAISIARQLSQDSCGTFAAWWSYSKNQFLVSEFSEYEESSTLADDLLAVFENGEQL